MTVSNRNNHSHPPPSAAGHHQHQHQERRSAELALVRSFVETVISSGQEVIQQGKQQRHRNRQAAAAASKGAGAASIRQQQHAAAGGFTAAEKPILQKQSYYNKSAGVAAGVATFAVALGSYSAAAWLLRRATSWAIIRRRGGGSGTSRKNSARLYDATVEHRQHRHNNQIKNYAALDRGGSIHKSSAAVASASAPVTTTLSATTTATIEASVVDEFWTAPTLAATFGSGLLGAFMAVSVSSFLFDSETFHQQLATIPLLPGKSHLCQHMCPRLLQQRDELLQLQEASATAAGGQPSSQQQQERQLWNDPETVELQAVTRLVHHCQLRMDYQKEIVRQRRQTKQQQQQQQSSRRQGDDDADLAAAANDDDDEPVDIAPPGVPLRYEYVDNNDKASSLVVQNHQRADEES